MRNLRPEQLAKAFGTKGKHGTLLPNGFEAPDHWDDEPVMVNLLSDEPVVEEEVEEPEPIPKFCFISYASEDREVIAPLNDAIKSIAPTWWDQDVSGGASWRDRIKSHLKEADCVLTFWTAESVASSYVREEAETAQKAGKLIPILLEDVTIPFGFAETQALDFRKWDGDVNAPQFRKLRQAIEDKFSPPTQEELSARMQRSSPVDFPGRDGRLGVAETPLGAPPPAPNPEDVTQRLEQIATLCERIQSRILDGAYNAPRDLGFAMEDMKDAAETTPARWYGLADAFANLKLLSDQAGEEEWNQLLANQLRQIEAHLAHIKPALEPAQIPPDNPAAKPAETDPSITDQNIGSVAEIGQTVLAETDGDAVKLVFDEEAKAVLHKLGEDLKTAAEAEEYGERDRNIKFARLRRVVRNAAMILGSATAAVSAGVATNVLTAPEAGKVLITRFQEILDLILKLF